MTLDGVTVDKKEDKLGQRASDTATISFNDVEVPADNLLGEENKGFKLAMMTLDRTRPGVAAMAVGIAHAAFEFARDYAKERVQFGVPIAMHQAIQFMIADMATKVEAARLLTWKSAVELDQGKRNTLISSHAKRFAADAAMEVTVDAVQVYGGYGFIKEYPVEKLMRDAKIMQLYEGTSQIQRLVIAREVLLPRQVEQPARGGLAAQFRIFGLLGYSLRAARSGRPCTLPACARTPRLWRAAYEAHRRARLRRVRGARAIAEVEFTSLVAEMERRCTVSATEGVRGLVGSGQPMALGGRSFQALGEVRELRAACGPSHNRVLEWRVVLVEQGLGDRSDVGIAAMSVPLPTPAAAAICSMVTSRPPRSARTAGPRPRARGRGCGPRRRALAGRSCSRAEAPQPASLDR